MTGTDHPTTDSPTAEPPARRRTHASPEESHGERVREAYTMTCRRCGQTWIEEYDVHRHEDSDGDRLEYFYRHDVPVPSPLSGLSCPHCTGYRVVVRRA